MTVCLGRIQEWATHPNFILTKACFTVSITNYIKVLPQQRRLIVSLSYLIRVVFNLSGRNGVIGERTAVTGHGERIWLSNRKWQTSSGKLTSANVFRKASNGWNSASHLSNLIKPTRLNFIIVNLYRTHMQKRKHGRARHFSNIVQSFTGIRTSSQLLKIRNRPLFSEFSSFLNSVY